MDQCPEALRHLRVIGHVAADDAAQIEVAFGAACIIGLIAVVPQELQHRRGHRVAFLDVHLAAVQNADPHCGGIQHYRDRTGVITLADLVVCNGVGAHSGVALSIPCPHTDDMRGHVAALRRREVQLVLRLTVAAEFLHGLAVQRDLDLVGVDGLCAQVGMAGDADRQLAVALNLDGRAAQLRAVQPRHDGWWTFAHIRLILAGQIRVIADAVLDAAQECAAVVQRQDEGVLCVQIQLRLIVLPVTGGQQVSVARIRLVHQTDTNIQVLALTQRIGHEGQLAVRQVLFTDGLRP